MAGEIKNMISSLALSVALLGHSPTPFQTKPLIAVSFDQDAITPQEGEEVAILETDKGRIVVMFFDSVAPNHAKNFKTLAKDGVYDGTRFHRCIPGFMIQGGDPLSKELVKSDYWGTGAPIKPDGTELNVAAEFSKLKHKRGILSMARSTDPDSAGSQFFIMVADNAHLDGQYSAFGKVLEGMDAVDAIVRTGSRENNGMVPPSSAAQIKTVTVAKWPIT